MSDCAASDVHVAVRQVECESLDRRSLRVIAFPSEDGHHRDLHTESALILLTVG